MLVVLDTSIVVQDFWFAGAQTQILLEACTLQEKTRIELCLPEVVIEELISNFRKQLRQHISDSSKILADARKLVREEVDYPVSGERLDGYVSQYALSLNSLVGGNNIHVLNYPRVEARDIVQRDLADKKPFGRNEKSAYRDYLIWMTILELAVTTTDDVVFITNNYHDFSVGPKPEEQICLHKDFVRDLEDRNIGEKRIKLFTSLSQFNDEVTKPSLDVLSPSYILDKRFGFTTSTTEQLKDLMENIWLDNAAVGLPLDYSDPKLVSVVEIPNLVVKDLRRLPPNTLVVSVEANIDCLISTAVKKENWTSLYQEGREQLEYWNTHADETYVEVLVAKTIHLVVTILMDNVRNCLEKG